MTEETKRPVERHALESLSLLLGSGLLFATACQHEPMQAAAEPMQAAENGAHAVAAPTAAVCVLRAVGDSGVGGTIEIAARGGALHLTGTITGLSPGLHGFHVHEFGDLTDVEKGKSVGSHFAPRGNRHGRPGDAQRHVGDLGNIEAGSDGTAKVDITDDVITLHGPHSVLGRAVVVHAGEDKFTQPTGDAGPHVAFGTIALKAASN